MLRAICTLLILGCTPLASAVTTASHGGNQAQLQLVKNPMPAIMALLEQLYKKNRKEAKQQAKLEEESRCFCTTKIAQQTAIVEELGEDLPELNAAVERLAAAKTQAYNEVKEIQKGIDEFRRAIEEATALFDKEHGDTEKELVDQTANLNAIDKAIAALRRGVGSSFLQTGNAAVLRNLIAGDTLQVSDADRDTLGAFLAEGNGDQDAGSDGDQDAGSLPSTEEVIGILRQIREGTVQDVARLQAAFNKAMEEHQELLASKRKQFKVLKSQLIAKKGNYGGICYMLAMKRGQIQEIMSQGYKREQRRLKELEESCAASANDHERQRRWLSNEAAALLDTINILGADDARDTFRSQLKSLDKPESTSSFLQLRATTNRQLLKRAERALESNPDRHHYKIDLIGIAMNKKLVDFNEINSMIRNLINTLERRAAEEEKTKNKCERLIADYNTDIENFKKLMSQIQSDIEKHKADVAAVQESIDSKKKEIRELDEAVDQMATQRSRERGEYMREKAANANALDILKSARYRMSSFYTSLLQIHGHAHVPAPGEEVDPQKVILMLKEIIEKLDMAMAQNDITEKTSEETYQRLKENSVGDRIEMSKIIDKFNEEKATLDTMLFDTELQLKRAKDQDAETRRTLENVHAGCDWLLANYNERTVARAGEIASLKTAKAALEGADYTSFLQKGQAHTRAQQMLRGSR